MGRLRSIFGLLLLVGMGHVLWQVVPAIFSNYQFEDVIAQEARAGSYSSKKEEDIRETVFQKAKELQIPIRREQIKVERNGNLVSISVDYAVPVDVPIYPFEMSFTPTTKSKGL